MNFQQLRSVREAVRCGFNLTEVAHTLHTSQPGVSRQIRELEEELGIELADHIHNVVWHEHNGQLFLVVQAWNPGYYFVLAQEK